MSEHMYKVIELVGTSTESWEKAASAAIERAGASLRDLRIAQVSDLDMQIEGGKESYQAILDSAVSRMRPVMMAASTTILGMAPLLSDVFFLDMAVVIMFGLGFASALTLIVVPVLYSIFFKIKART